MIVKLQNSLAESKDSTLGAYKFFISLTYGTVIITILVGMFFLNKSVVAFKIMLILFIGNYFVLVLKIIQREPHPFW